ncbi:MAG: DUF4019 domain-containing protein [Myxococcota bacterium]
MTHRFTVLIFLLFASIASTVGCGSGDEDDASEMASQWLTLIDMGDVTESWEQSSGVFQNNLSIEDYTKSIKDSRGHLGKLLSRRLRTAQAARSLPNAPRGRYVVVQFDSVFANHPAMVETVTAKFENGDWRVLGYRSR